MADETLRIYVLSLAWALGQTPRIVEVGGERKLVIFDHDDEGGRPMTVEDWFHYRIRFIDVTEGLR